MAINRSKLFLAPSQKNPLVKRWQDMANRGEPAKSFIDQVFGDEQVFKIDQSPFMDNEQFRSLVEMDTRLNGVKEKVKNSHLVIADKTHPIYEVLSDLVPTPFTYWDKTGHSAIITSDNIERDFPLLAHNDNLGAPIEAVVAAHELAHAWDIGGLGMKVPGVSNGDRLLSSIMLEDGLGFMGGRLPDIKGEDEIAAVAPRIRRMKVSPVEAPAVLTELAAFNHDGYKMAVDHNPWIEKFMNMFYGNRYGSRAYHFGGAK